MGTTLTALQADGGIAVDYVIAVEGYGYLLTSGTPAAAVTAWSGTDWSAAIGGAEVSGKLGQSLDPWKPFGEASTITITVVPCPGQSAGDDRFGLDVWNRTGGVVSELRTSIDCDDTTINVKRTDDFAASGTIYIESEAIAYSSRDTAIDQFTVSTRGKWSPFTTSSAQRFTHPHRLTDTVTDADGVTVPPDVSSLPRQWVGRWVAVYAHRRLGTVLDVVAQAHLVFAGRIREIEETEDGATSMTCDDLRASINNTLLLRNQYTARISEGIYVPTGTIFYAWTYRAARQNMNNLVVVASGAAGANQMNAGLYSAEEIAQYLNTWFASEKTAARSYHHVSYLAYVSTSAGLRPQIKYSDPTAGSANRGAFLSCTEARVARALGWNPNDDTAAIFAATSNVSATGTGIAAPMRVILSQQHGLVSFTLAVESPRGEWIDQSTILPAPFVGSGAWEGYLQVGDKARVIAYQVDASTFQCMVPGQTTLFTDFTDTGLSVEEEGDLEVRQVIVAEGKFKTLFAQMLSSTGTSVWNNAFDVLSEGLGCGIPDSLITTLVNTDLPAVAFGNLQLNVEIDKPTKFAEVFAADLIVRKSFLVWAAGALRLTSWATPTAAYASVALTESNKAAPIDTRDKMRSSAVESDAWMCNVVKIRYGRRVDGSYDRIANLEDASSARANGAKPITIDLRNINVQQAPFAIGLVSSFTAWMPVLSRPVIRVRRTIARTLFETAVAGAQATLTDEHVRDWATGLRGITGRPALVVGHWFDWGGSEHGVDGAPRARPPTGEVELLMYPSNTAQYVPCAQVDDTAAGSGYAASVFTCYAHKHSESAEAADATRFVAGDKIFIVEIDPDVPGSTTSWSREVQSQTGNTITITAALAAPAWDSTKKYRIIYQGYASCQASQQTKCFQADDADGLIADTLAAYEYSHFTGPQSATLYTAAAATDLPARYATSAYGDAVGLDTGYELDVANLANNLIGFKTAPQCPRIYSEARPYDTGTWSMVEFGPKFVGIGTGLNGATGQTTRKLYLAPQLKVSSGTGYVRVTLGTGLPYGTSLADATFPEPYKQLTFSTVKATYETAATQSMDISHLLLSLGWGWIAVEVSANTTYLGMAVDYIGPLETA